MVSRQSAVDQGDERMPPSALASSAVSGCERANVLGIGVSALNMEKALTLICAALDTGRKGYICATDVRAIVDARRDLQLRRILNESFLTLPDGKPTVWVGRIQHFRKMDQVGGPELMLELCRVSEERGYTHFLFGGKPGVADELRRVLLHRYRHLRIVGTYTPPFRALSAGEQAGLVRDINSLRPDVFWVGISTPKQERFMAEYLPKLDVTLMVGVGAAFDFHTGRVRSAPIWMKRAGLAWMFRICQEPRRLWKRYCFGIPFFLGSIALQLSGLRTYGDGSERGIHPD